MRTCADARETSLLDDSRMRVADRCAYQIHVSLVLRSRYDTRMSDSDELDRLAERGRRLTARETASARSPIDTEAEEARRRLRASVSHYVRWRWGALGTLGWVLAALAVGAVAPESWHQDGDEGGPALGVGMLVGALVATAAWRLRPSIGERAIAHEEAWVHARPFLLTGYLEALASSSTEGCFRLVLELDAPRTPTDAAATFRSPAARSTPPDEALLADVFRTVGAKVRPDSVPGFWEVEHVWDFGDTSVLTNAHVHAWMHRVVAVLETLHTRHPVRSVSVLGFAPPGARRSSSS